MNFRTGSTETTAVFVAILAAGIALSPAATPIATWHFEPEHGAATADSANGLQDTLHGNAKFSLDGVRGQCLKLDGFSVYAERAAAKAPKLSGSFSIEAWVALQEYPWNWTAIVDRQADHKAGYSLGIDYQGGLGLDVSVNGRWIECNNAVREYNAILHTDGWNPGGVHTMVRADRKLQFSINGVGDLESSATIPSETWTHVAIVYSSSARSCQFYLNGKLDATVPVRRPVKAVLGNLEIGGWSGGNRNYKGDLDDFRIYRRALSGDEVGMIAAGSGPSDPVAWWKFDETSGDVVMDAAGAHNGSITGASFVLGKHGNALGLDGTDQCVRVPAIGSFDDLTLSVWIRPVITSTTLPLLRWNHVVGTYDPAHGISLYLNGEPVASRSVTGRMTDAAGTSLLLGLSHEKLAPVNTERGPSMVGSPMLLSGLLDEVKIYDAALSPIEVRQAYASVRPAKMQPLEYNPMPTGPLGKGEFGASREALPYCDAWDDNYRMNGPADVVVKFDELPVNYVFWHGWNYGLCMVTENGLLIADQSVERSDENGCVEHMSDKQNRYSHISLIENNEARVVLHWRYAPCDIFYKQVNVDPQTGWGDWVDEYFYIYPDGVMMREQTLWTTGHVERRRVGGYGGDPSNQETIFFSQPGRRQLDTVEVSALTMANDAGESRTFSWQPDFPSGIGREPSTPTIQMVNFKSAYKPFLIRRPGATVAPFPPSGHIDRNFPYWNHWPVSQLPNDGRKGTRTDRPAHTSLSWFCEPPISADGIRYTWTYMYGLTTKTAPELAPLSKAWNSPALLTVQAGSVENHGFDTCQRAYIFDSKTPGRLSRLDVRLQGSEASPIANPAFVIRDWGESIPSVTVNGKVVPRGKDCRVGINRRLEGSDLVVWLRRESATPMTVSLIPSTRTP